MKVLNILFALSAFACTSSSERSQLVDFGKYSIVVPNTWSQYVEDGIDSRVTTLVTPSKDTIYFNYGKNVRGFTKTVKVHSMESKIHFDSIDWPYRDEMIFSKDAAIEEGQGIYLDEYYRYDTIAGRRAKIMQPKIEGNGAIGIHFDSLNEKGEKLTIVSKKVPEEVQSKLTEAFYTIRFEE